MLPIQIDLENTLQMFIDADKWNAICDIMQSLMEIRLIHGIVRL